MDFPSMVVGPMREVQLAGSDQIECTGNVHGMYSGLNKLGILRQTTNGITTDCLSNDFWPHY